MKKRYSKVVDTFWTGPMSEPEKRKLVVKWLPPIPVGFKFGDDIIPTIKIVKD